MQTLFQESRNNFNESKTLEQRRGTQHNLRMGGLESIYMRSQQKSASNRVASAARPFRPTMQQYEDDPSELVVETHMEGTRFGKNAAKDVNLLMQGEVDKI